MRLKSLKLSGFKSFVDTTKFSFPTNLSGIVGPNGCGKSNTIDAVRWVMGERSAKHLRGDSMSDVIFNGAKTRKPVGQASVELIFDNTSDRIKGKYAAYNEISVRRAVSREGISDYFLNGTKCRRRDIMDILLGTGLGSRSYAIIEQGMISRLVEAKPDDLRAMIEEAAGISKYKERRRDTENRIRHTKENLSRIIDLKEEIEKQLQRLERQVKAAKKYKELKTQERQLKAQVLSLKWHEQTEKYKEWLGKIQQKEVAMEAELASLQGKNTELEKTNQELLAANDNLTKTQAEYYQANSEISAMEQTLQSSKERVSQITDDLNTLRQKIQKDQQIQENDEKTALELSTWINSTDEKLQSLSKAHEDTDRIKTEAETKWHDWQNIWGQLQQDVLKSEQKTDSAKIYIKQLQKQEAQLNARRQKINDELNTIPRLIHNDQALIEKIKLEQEELDKLHNFRQEIAKELKDARDSYKLVNSDIDKLKQERQKCAGRIESLDVLKQNALGNNDELLKNWLNDHNLADAKRLFEAIEIKPGWEQAAQVCLVDFINAVCVENDSNILDTLIKNDFAISIIDINKKLQSHNKLGKTLDEVISGVNSQMFSHIYIAETEDAAFKLRAKLRGGESVISKSGLWLGSNWTRKVDLQHAEHNILKFEHELKQETLALTKLASEVTKKNNEITLIDSRVKELEEQLDNLHKKINQVQIRLANADAKKSAEDAKIQHAQKRQSQLEQELAEVDEHLVTTTKDLAGSKHDLNSALELVCEFSTKKQATETRKDSLHSDFVKTRQDADEARSQYHALAVEFESKQSRLDEINNHIHRIKGQCLEEKKQESLLQTRLEDSRAPIREMETKLKSLLQAQLDIDKKLGIARSKANEIEYARHQQEDLYRQVEDKIQQSRSKLENLRLQAQESNVRATTLIEELQAKNLDPQEYLDNLPTESNIRHYQEKILETERKIERLGAINLAAMEEFKTESERKTYIDKQHADLSEALETLKTAISKIDKETKSRFKQTFDEINSGLQNNFPTLFGGGKASLTMTSEDLLETGVNIMAQPPGKRNSTIHLLSGGEKALTAVALVFAIFALNPAPFCMLDEVDAPLDDTNVERFCKMVRQMSERIQFIIVTHNKITMELVNQLTGVTMQEAGVSRMVTVNLDEAAKMVEA